MQVRARLPCDSLQDYATGYRIPQIPFKVAPQQKKKIQKIAALENIKVISISDTQRGI